MACIIRYSMQNQGGLQRLHMRKRVLFLVSNEALILAQQQAVTELGMLQLFVNMPIELSIWRTG